MKGWFGLTCSCLVAAAITLKPCLVYHCSMLENSWGTVEKTNITYLN